MEERKSDKNNKISQMIMPDDPQAAQHALVITKRIDTFNPHRREMTNETNANICYIVGQQNIVLVGNIIKPSPRSRISDEVVNLILPAVQNDVAVATSSPAIYDVVPAGTDEDDRATAIVGQKILPSLQRKIGRGFKRAEAVLWWNISTVGWRKVYYDPNFAVVGVNPDPVNEDGSPNPGHNPDIGVGEAILEGEVQIDCVPTNQLIYDYRETDLTKLKWIIQAQRVTANWVTDRYGPEVQQKLSAKFSKQGVLGETEFEFNVNEAFNNSQRTQNTFVPKLRSSYEMQLKSDEYIDYYEYWERPTKSMPTGAYAVMLGNQIVFHGPYPIEMYPHGELPFVPAAPMNIPGVTNGSISRVSQARPLQRKFNELSSQIDENITIMGNSIIMTPRGCKLRHKTLDNGAGNIIEYDSFGGGKPTREAGIPMNGQVFTYLNEKKMAIDTLFAFHEPSRGLAPRNIESGKGLQRLQDADTRQLGPIVEAFEESDQRVAYQALTLAIANYPQDKMINVVGTDYDWALYKVDRKQLQGKLNVIVRRHSSMPVDKEAESIQAYNAWTSGLLGDPQDPQIRIWTLEQMSMGNATNILQKHSKQKNFAAKEFVMAEENLKTVNIPPDASDEQVAAELEKYLYIPQINAFDDHQVHIACHNEYLMSNFWKARASGNPLAIELIGRMNMHIMHHQQIVMQQQQMQYERDLRAQMLIKGKTMEQIALSKMDLSDNKNDNKNKKGQ